MLFAQWQRARGARSAPAARPFSRSWEDLLADAHLASADERSEAERDARALAAAGWLELKPVPYRQHLIGRVVIPLGAEPRWCAAFGFSPPTEAETRRIRDFPWEPELRFLSQDRPNLAFDELCQLNDFLKDRTRWREILPIKERSLEIFGDEKRLDLLLASALFRPGRLDLARDLHCEVIGVPLAWKRGPAAAREQPIIALENAATWHSYCRWNAQRGCFSAVVYGDGNRFADGILYLPDLFAELGGVRRVLYFGDLDFAGLAIPQEASTRAQAAGLPAIEPHQWSYEQLLGLGTAGTASGPGEVPPLRLCDWLGPCAAPARRLLAAGQRLAQERVNWEFLRDHQP